MSRTRDTAHLLVGERFNPLLPPGERLLRDALARFVADVTALDAEADRTTIDWVETGVKYRTAPIATSRLAGRHVFVRAMIRLQTQAR